MILTLKLPWPPSTNRYYRVVNNRAILSKEAREYRARVIEQFGTNSPLAGSIGIVIYATPPNRVRRDLDNMLKQPLDALQHAGVYTDDSQIDQLMIRRMESDKLNPHLLVMIDDGYTDDPS
jgi:crossover junction endodeoxyribonuclease RusA